MKTKLITRTFLLGVAMFAFVVLQAGNAFGIQNSSRVVAPYWQVDSGSYTFIAVSHGSLSGMASQVGVTINALTNDGSAYATAVDFTITTGSTQRIFIIPTNHASITSTTIPTATFLAGTSDFKHGHVRFDPKATSPNTRSSQAAGFGDGFRDITMLNYWGSVVVETNTTGFAMEFLGDVHDSAAPATFIATTGGLRGTPGVDVGH